MSKQFQPGDRVRVADRTLYEPMAVLMRKCQPPDGFVVESCSIYSHHIEYGDMYAVQIRYPDDSLSGAIYADIFDKVP